MDSKRWLIVAIALSGTLNVAFVGLAAWHFGVAPLQEQQDETAAVTAALAEAEADYESRLSEYHARLDTESSNNAAEVEELRARIAELETADNDSGSAHLAQQKSSEDDSFNLRESLREQREKKVAELPFPPRANYSHGYAIVTEYDDYDSATEIELTIPNLMSNVKLAAWHSFDGQSLTKAPTYITIMFTYNGETYGGWRYINSAKFSSFLADGAKIAPGFDWDGDAGTSLEWMAALVSIEDFLSMANAQELRGRLGLDEYSFSAEQMEALRDFASQLNPNN